MAEKKTKKSAIESPAVEMPTGFQKVNNEQSNAWFKPAEGAIISGELLGRFQMRKTGKDNKIRFFYQVKIDQPVSVARKVEGDTEIETAEIGEIVNVDEKSATECLAAHCGPGKRNAVWLCFREKIDLDGGQTFWRIDVGVRPLDS